MGCTAALPALQSNANSEAVVNSEATNSVASTSASAAQPLAPSDTSAVCATAQAPESTPPYAQAATQVPTDLMPTIALPDYIPPQTKASIHPTNYGDRFAQDLKGRPLTNKPLVVLHETVGPVTATINTFQTPHSKDEDQVSYHAIITLDGTIVHLVPSAKRAFGAGNSIFKGPQGPETVQTKADLPPSVNNFAYHISLETPFDGNNNQDNHSGYTEAQYQSLAWLVAKTKVTDERIVTHAQVDQAGDRKDPRSFDFDKFLGILHSTQAQATAACVNPS